MSVIYLIGSLRNPSVPVIAAHLRSVGFEVFDDWYAAGPTADDCWRDYEVARGHSYKEALQGYAATHIFDFDMFHLNRCDIGVLVMPTGKSGHLELGYLVGRGKPCYVLFDKTPERYDVMYQFAQAVFFDVNDLSNELKKRHCYASI
jgi:hypothetical protein